MIFLIRASGFDLRRRKAFTLIEVMIVVAIIGLIAAMGLPSLANVLRKEGMRKAISDVVEVCGSARAKAIFSGHTVAIIFHPTDKSFSVEGGGAGNASTYVSSSHLPDDVELEALGINSMDYTRSEWARVFFYPDGTCDEMTIVLHSRDEWQKITLEFSTGFATVSSVNR